MKLAGQVTIYEVGLRDGLQLESKVLTVDEKVEIFSFLQKANVPEIEFGSLSILSSCRKWQIQQRFIRNYSHFTRCSLLLWYLI